jgi:hypothetical protein
MYTIIPNTSRIEASSLEVNVVISVRVMDLLQLLLLQ